MAESASRQNLPSSSNQSFDDKIYLKTHTWHAKYFHMIDKWRHEIPYYSMENILTAYTEKSLTSYKAITENCLLQDISYYTCVEILGEKNWLEANLNKHCDYNKTFTEDMCTSGQREGTVMFFGKNGYPAFPIGYVNFFWKPSETNIKTIWIWVHLAFYSDFLREIISSFDFKQNKARQGRTDISHNLNDLYTNDEGCQMRVLKSALNRFRLSGPTALTVLKQALHVPSLTELNLESKSCPMTEQSSLLNDEKQNLTSSRYYIFVKPLLQTGIKEKANNYLTIKDLRKKMWHTEYYKKRENIEAFKMQKQMWQSMNVLGSPSSLPSNIIGLTVLDPRFCLHPKRRKKTKIFSDAEKLPCQSSTNLSHSPIWDAKIRRIVNSSCMSSKALEKIEPVGSPNLCVSKNKVAKIPILLIQKPAVATASLGLGSSIDIVIPSRWAVVFWMALVKQSEVVGGLLETELIVFESLGTYVPDINDPDTPAYMREALERKEELINEYFSHSPIPKVNFIKLGIRSPFFCDWKNLIKGWSGVEDFYVLRHFEILGLLRTEMKTIERKSAESESTVQVSEFDTYENCLVQVKLSIVKKGTPQDFAIICMPTLEDLKRFPNLNYDGPVEQRHTDPMKEFRDILRGLYLEQLYELKRQHRDERKSTSQDNVLPGKSDVIHDEINNAKLSEDYRSMLDCAREMRKLYLPESTEVRHSCDREVMGYVTMGGYSFLRAKGIGIGYVTLPSLLEIIRARSNIVLVRNTKDLQYRFARLEILVDECAS